MINKTIDVINTQIVNLTIMLNENIVQSHILLKEYKESNAPFVDVTKDKYNESIKLNYELNKILKHLRKSVKKLGKISESI